VSLEIGRRFLTANDWWIAPGGTQTAVTWLSGKSSRTGPQNTELDVKVDAATSAQYRLQARFGRRIHDSRWTPYGQFGAVKTDTHGEAIHATRTAAISPRTSTAGEWKPASEQPADSTTSASYSWIMN
jgi:outer membrane autotransporter protein